MGKKLIDEFFKNNGVSDPNFPSACAIANFRIKMMQNAELSKKFSELTDEVVLSSQPKRKEDVDAELAEINAADSYEQIIKFMRRGVDNINDDAFVAKALTFENELVPEIIKRLKTSLNTSFIELSTRVMALCNMDLADNLLAYFDDVRSPYAQSMILVALGFKAGEEHIPQIIEKYHQLKKHYPRETHSDGAFYALTEIEGRLYAESS